MTMVGMISNFNSMLWQNPGASKKYDTAGMTVDEDSVPKGTEKAPLAYYPVQWGVNTHYNSYSTRTDTDYSYTIDDAGTQRTITGNKVNSKKNVECTTIDFFGSWQFSSRFNLKLFSGTDISVVGEKQTITQNSWSGGAQVPGLPVTYNNDYTTISTGLGAEAYGVLMTGQRYDYGTINGFSYLGGLEFRGYREFLSPQYYSDQYKVSLSNKDSANFETRISGMLLGDFSPGDTSKYLRFTALAGANVLFNSHSDVVTSSSRTELDPVSGDPVPVGTDYTWAGKYYTTNANVFGEFGMLAKYKDMYLKPSYRISYRSNNYLAADKEFREERILEQFFPVEAGYIIRPLNTKVSGEVVFKLPASVSGEDHSGVEEGIYSSPIDSASLKLNWKNEDLDVSVRGGIKNGGVPGVVHMNNSDTRTYTDRWQTFVEVSFKHELNWGQ